jgi:hypothetical protein
MLAGDVRDALAKTIPGVRHRFWADHGQAGSNTSQLVPINALAVPRERGRRLTYQPSSRLSGARHPGPR